jgi:hypothetical protein
MVAIALLRSLVFGRIKGSLDAKPGADVETPERGANPSKQSVVFQKDRISVLLLFVNIVL